MTYGNKCHEYELIDEWIKLPEDESLLDVSSVCIDDNDNVIVLNRGDYPIRVFNSTGEQLSCWGENYFSDRPHGMGIGPQGYIYCTDDKDHTVSKFTQEGDLLMMVEGEDTPSDTGYRHVPDLFERIASITRGAGPFNRPTGVTVFDSGEIFAADGYGNARIHKFNSEGDLLHSWGEPGPNAGEFRLPHSIHCDNENQIWVTDRENSRIQIFDADGVFISEWVDLIRPTDMAINDNKVFVSELCNRISIFTIGGELLTRWGNENHPADDPLFDTPHTIAVDSEGDLYVGEVLHASKSINHEPQTLQKFRRIK